LDGDLPGAPEKKTGADEQPTDVASGPAQIDYVRRFVRQLKSSDRRPLAIGVLGSDLYDKLLLLRGLRHEFPDAVLFTTDLDDRLLHRSEYSWTRNLLIASHYNLSLCEPLQGAAPPFRSSYQTSLFLGTLTMLKDRQLLRDAALKEALDRAAAEPPAVQLFEVGRTGSFNLNQFEADAVNPAGDRLLRDVGGRTQIVLAMGVAFSIIFLLTFRGAVRDFFCDACRRQFNWRHVVVVIFSITAIALWIFILRDHFYSPDGEPFALYEGISSWPTICLRVLLIAFCAYSVFRADELLYGSYQDVSRDVLRSDGTWTRPSRKEQWRTCWTSFSPARCWSWWKTNIACDKQRDEHGEPQAVDGDDTLERWFCYAQANQFLQRHVRLTPQLLVVVLFIGLLFMLLGLAASPVRGLMTRTLNRIVFIVCGLVMLWLMFFTLDAICLCNRLIGDLVSGNSQWPARILQREAARRALKDSDRFRRILDHLLDVQLVARHTDVVARLVYAPCVAVLIWFVARHPIFDKWSWPPQISISFGVCLTIAIYSATVLGRSAIRVKQRALQDVDAVIASMPRNSDTRKQAEALRAEIEATRGGAMVPLPKNPVVAAALLPFGSLSSLYLLDFVIEHLGQ
jgi:hypothetical protein